MKGGVDEAHGCLGAESDYSGGSQPVVTATGVWEMVGSSRRKLKSVANARTETFRWDAYTSARFVVTLAIWDN